MGTEENKEENLKRLIHATGEEKVSFNFTEHVVKGIQTELQNQAVTESSLKSVLQKHAIEQPSADFQVNLIKQLSAATRVQYKPIISRRSWYGIAAAVSALLIASYFYPSATPVETPRIVAFLGRVARSILVAPNISGATLEIIVLTLIGLSALLLLDHFFRQKLSAYNKLARP